MNVKVPVGKAQAFIEEVRTKPEWYVEKKYNPEARKGDKIRFYEGSVLVATAKVDRIDSPKLDVKGDLDFDKMDRWIVWFLRETFRVAGEKEKHAVV